ncbi:hypothetical protein V8F06_009647 [Rhypophila decipiens]
MAGNKSFLQKLLSCSCLPIPRRATQHGGINGTAIPLVATAAPAATGQPLPPAGGGAPTAPQQQPQQPPPPQPQQPPQQQPQPQQQNQPPAPHAPPAPNPAPAVAPAAVPGNRPAQIVRRPGLTYEFPLIGTNVDPWLAESYLNDRLGGQENYQFWPELDRLTLRTNRPLTQVSAHSRKLFVRQVRHIKSILTLEVLQI